ncbi:putative plasma membrane low affinity zinc ion transporter [Trichodelitschia bisporula]|uniref:Putative plasma membrane low affinity zinc ion transporter n=1 Tax=Trichodelitschia bisporula TaxID=703511 RepID=A0A6G1I363_9PEZI|nr:putative plasma membrane low affinity zinc ion transporter [Trichodelitschia bisporula]
MISVPLIGQPGHCAQDNEYSGQLGLRISAIFVIFIGSLLGALFPIFAKKYTHNRAFEILFFIAKYFGSGVIIATAFIHLLAPAHEALNNPCLQGPITEYSWVEGIVLMTIFSMFLLETLTMRFASFGHDHSHGEAHSHGTPPADEELGHAPTSASVSSAKGPEKDSHGHTPMIGDDHLGHGREHTDNSSLKSHMGAESYAAQMTAIFILEFGVVFHSIFIGLTLAVAGSEFVTLYVVLVFHQTFEGLGLGTRLCAAPWPRGRAWTPYALGIGYAISTPSAIAVGLGVRKSFSPGSQAALVANGVFDSVSAGILIYTGLVELMAHEFMFSPSMRQASIGKVLSAFGVMCLGAGLMALLGKWA